jgi:hypothetical protein
MMKICDVARVSAAIRYSTAIFTAVVVAWTATAIPLADIGTSSDKPGNDAGAKPFDRSCYVREEDGLVRYYLEGPPREGELPYLQGLPITGADRKVVVRNEVPQSAIPPRILQAPPCPPGKHHLS